MKKFFTVALLAGTVAACQTTAYKPVSENLPMLKVSFAGGSWDGNTVPSDQICSLFGGKGSTPALKVSGVPAGTNAIIVEFNDRNYPPMSSDGGHGKIGFWVSESGSLVLNPVPAESSELGDKAFVEANGRGGGRYAKPGYLPPCSGGKGNAYFAEVKAVYKAKAEGEESKLLAEGKIELGTY